MDDLMTAVNQRANLAFSNQMEMLTFHLTDSQQYGINVFKIIEVIETPKKITKLPNAHPAVVGAIDFRDRAISVIDLAFGLGLPLVDYKNSISYIIVCEYSTTTQGFLISSPNTLLTKGWEEIKSPGGSFTNEAYLTAITYDDAGATIQILDVEKILGEIIGINDQVAENVLQLANHEQLQKCNVLLVDDSRAARSLLKSTLAQLGVRYSAFSNAASALEHLNKSLSGEVERVDLIISDIEMPGMDGFTFTRQVKANPRLANIHLVLHSSLSNQSNRLKAEQVGANGFIAKFQADEVAQVVLSQLNGL